MTISTPSCLPRQPAGRLGAEHLDVLAVDDEHVVLGLSGGGFLRGDRALEAALGGIVFEEVGEIVGGNDVADRDDIDFLAEQTLLGDGAKHQTADAAETIDSDFDSHILFQFQQSVFKTQAGHVTAKSGRQR